MVVTALVIVVSLHLHTAIGNPERSYVAICLAVKDQGLDLREWVSYHVRLGVSKFYVYDNDSNPPLLSFLLDYVRDNVIEYSYVPGRRSPNSQIYIYQRCLSEYGHLHSWLGFIDADEYIYIANESSNLPEALRMYEKYGGLVLNWMMVGSSGHIHRPDGGVIANYHNCNENYHVKSFVRPSKTLKPLDPHHFTYRGGKKSTFVGLVAASVRAN